MAAHSCESQQKNNLDVGRRWLQLGRSHSKFGRGQPRACRNIHLHRHHTLPSHGDRRLERRVQTALHCSGCSLGAQAPNNLSACACPRVPALGRSAAGTPRGRWCSRATDARPRGLAACGTRSGDLRQAFGAYAKSACFRGNFLAPGFLSILFSSRALESRPHMHAQKAQSGVSSSTKLGEDAFSEWARQRYISAM